MARFMKSRKDSRGKAPGSLVFIGRQKMEKIQVRQFSYNDSQLIEETLPDINSIPEFDKDLVNWINIDGLHDVDAIEYLRVRYNISALAMEDILNTDHRPRIIEEEGHLIVITKSFYWNEEEEMYRTEQISFILSENYLITIQERIGDHFEPVRKRLREKVGKIRNRSTDYLFYALMDTLVDSYLSIIEIVAERIEAMEDKIIGDSDQSILVEIYRYKNELRLFRKNIRPVKELSGLLSKTASGLIHEDTKVFLIDMEDLVLQATESIDLYYLIVSDQLNLYHTNVANRANDTMKVLTIFASIFIPLTFIAGVYGTNFEYIPELKLHSGYFMMWGVMIAVLIIMLIFFKRRKWF